MSSLADMIESKLIKEGDTVEFKFKGNYFTGKLKRGGLIAECFHQRKTKTPCLQNVIAFTSLTAWTEACLQDVLEEYYTRYSSWKRVVHKESGLTMGELRDRCKLLNSKIDQEAYKEIYRLTIVNAQLKEFILSKGFKIPKCSRDLKSVVKKPVVHMELKNRQAYNRIQRIMINKPKISDNELYNYLT